MKCAAIAVSPEAAQTVPANFNRLARVYRWAEWFTFGPVLTRCRSEFLPLTKSRRSALVIGDGDGRFTRQLLQHNAQIVVDAVDSSNAMLSELTRRAVPHASRVTIHNVDARGFNSPSSRYDLVVTHFFLDCLSTQEVATLAARQRESVSDDAVWVVSEFAVPKTRYGKLVAKPLVAVLYRLFGVLTGLRIRQLPDHCAALAQSGFRLMQRRARLFGLLVSELWQADNRC